MKVKLVFLSSSMLPRKCMSSFSSYNFFICMVEMNEGFICIYQQFNSICFITCAILKASVFAILTKARKQTYGCTKVRSEAGITTSHIWLSEVSLEFWISSKMAVRLGVRPGYCAFPVHPRKWKILFKTILVCSEVEGLWHTFSKTDKLQNSCGSYPGHMFFFGKGGTCRNLKKWWYIYINR